MKEQELDNLIKAERHPEVWFTYFLTFPEETPCEMCHGEPTFIHNKIEYVCPHCFGQGKVIRSKKKYFYTSGVVVSKIEFDGAQRDRYIVAHSRKGTAEILVDDIFLSEREAKRNAYEHNKAIKE
jgi:hypothetical protein